MYNIRLGYGCGIKATLLTASGEVCDLRKARYKGALLVLPNGSTIPCADVSVDDVTNAMYVRLLGDRELTTVGKYGILFNVKMANGVMYSSPVVMFGEVQGDAEMEYKELNISIAVTVSYLPANVAYTGASPKISPNGTWLVYNDEINAYEDTGEPANYAGILGDIAGLREELTTEKITDKVAVDWRTVGKNAQGEICVLGGDTEVADFLDGYLKHNGYVQTEDLDDYATRKWVEERRYITRDDIPLKISAFVNDKGYITLDALAPLAKKATTLAGYGITNAYTKEETEAAFFKYTKIDGYTIKRNKDGFLYVDSSVIGGGGGTADSVAWSNITGKPSWIGSTKPSYSYDEITGAPDLSIYALSATTLAGYGITDTYTKTHIDNTFVKLAAAQSIQARHDFTDGLEVGGMPIYKSKDDTVYLDCNLVVRGGITAFGTNKTITASLFEALPIDGKTIKRNPETNELYVDVSVIGGGGIDEEQLEKYLVKYNYATTSDISSALNGYATESWVLSQKYLTGISSSMVTDALGYSPFSSSGGTINGSITATSFIGNLMGQWLPWLPSRNANEIGTTFGWMNTAQGDSNIPSDGAGCIVSFDSGVGLNTMQFFSPYTTNTLKYRSRTHIDNSWKEWKEVAFTDSNVASATKLATPRTIWGQSFDGSENIWGNLTNVGDIYSRGAQNGGYVIYSSIRWDEALSIEVTDAKGNWLSNGIAVKTNGNVAIGGTTADAKLHIYGNVIAQNAYGGAEFVFDNNIGQNRAIFVLDPNPNNGVGMGLDYLTLEQRADGVATLSSPYLSLTLGNDKVLTVDGNFLAKGGITAQNSSDRRLKRNIRKFNASKVLMSLGSVWEYEYIDSEVERNHIYEGTHYGLIYQHVKGTKLDIMCHEREDGMGALNYLHPKFISLIAGATMENITEVEKLKRKIRHLEQKVKRLERGEA